MAEMMIALSMALLADDADNIDTPAGRAEALQITQDFLTNAERHGAAWSATWGIWAVGVAQVRAGQLKPGIDAIIESLRQQFCLTTGGAPSSVCPRSRGRCRNSPI